MKMLVAIALVATSVSVTATAAVAAGNDNTASERRVCTQVAQARAGSRMTPRRLCRTPAQWQEALGPDWRQHVSGRYLEDELDALQTRGTPVNPDGIGQQGIAFSSTRQRGPR